MVKTVGFNRMHFVTHTHTAPETDYLQFWRSKVQKGPSRLYLLKNLEENPFSYLLQLLEAEFSLLEHFPAAGSPHPLLYQPSVAQPAPASPSFSWLPRLLTCLPPPHIPLPFPTPPGSAPGFPYPVLTPSFPPLSLLFSSSLSASHCSTLPPPLPQTWRLNPSISVWPPPPTPYKSPFLGLPCLSTRLRFNHTCRPFFHGKSKLTGSEGLEQALLPLLYLTVSLHPTATKHQHQRLIQRAENPSSEVAGQSQKQQNSTFILGTP